MWGLPGKTGFIKASFLFAVLTFSEIAICVEPTNRELGTSNPAIVDALENTFQTRINREMEMQRIRHSLQSATQKMKDTRARFSGPISELSNRDLSQP